MRIVLVILLHGFTLKLIFFYVNVLLEDQGLPEEVFEIKTK